MRRLIKPLVLLSIVILIAFRPASIKSSLVKFSPPTSITNVQQTWVLTGFGGCHVSGYRYTAEGSTGATSYTWEWSTNGTSWNTWGGSGVTTTTWFGDQSCDHIYMQVKANNADGSSAYFPFDSDLCPPFDNPECLGLKKKNLPAKSKALKK